MPDLLGATPEEIDHYERMLTAATRAVRELQTQPFNQQTFDYENDQLRAIYEERSNPYIWGTNGNTAPLFDLPKFLGKLAAAGSAGDVIPLLEKELVAAAENLRTMKAIRSENFRRLLPS